MENDQREATTRAAAEEISMNAAVVAVLPERDGNFTLKKKEHKKMTLKAFLSGQHTFATEQSS